MAWSKQKPTISVKKTTTKQLNINYADTRSNDKFNLIVTVIIKYKSVLSFYASLSTKWYGLCIIHQLHHFRLSTAQKFNYNIYLSVN